jgi:predicted DNA-binding transcriptional regulator AlpA
MAMRKSDLNVDLAGRELIVAGSLLAMLDWSKSTLHRAINDELGFRTPFPRPIRLGKMRINFWNRSSIEKWLEAEQAAAE